MKPIEFQRTFSVLGPKPPILAGKNRRPISRSTVAQEIHILIHENFLIILKVGTFSSDKFKYLIFFNFQVKVKLLDINDVIMCNTWKNFC